MKYEIRIAALAAVSALALAACSSESENEASAPAMDIEQAAQEFGKLEKPEPGQYDLNVEITRFDMPGAPEGTLDTMKGVMESAYADGFCLTAEDADKGFEEQLAQVAQNGKCDFSEMSVDDGKVNAKAMCTLEGGTMELAMNGAVSATHSDITADTKMNAQGRTMGMTVRMEQTRTGDCAG